MNKALLIALALMPLIALGDDGKGGSSQATKPTPTIVSVTGKATDVRAIVADLFAQAKRNYVLQPGIQAALFLSLDKVDFEEALNIICTQAKLQFEVQNGIYFITKKVVIAPAAPTPKGSLDKKALAHKLTSKFAKTEIRTAFAEFAKQTDVVIEVDKSVPNYKVDASLKHVTLRYALDKITEAAGLKYKLTDNLSILIYKPDDGNKVAVSGG